MAAVNNFIGKIAANNRAESLDHLKDSAAAPGAEVPGLDARLVVAQVFEGSEMSLGEIDNVDVIADGSAVVRRIVCIKLVSFVLFSAAEVATYHHQTRGASRVCQSQHGPAEAAGCRGHLGDPRP